MPARQRGSVVSRGKTWAARWRDETDAARFRGGFATKTEARTWLDRKVDEVEALRRGDRVTPSEIPTVAEFVDAFLATHEVDPATTDKLRYELKHATRAFGDKRLDQLRTPELAAWRPTLPARSRHQLFRSFRQVLEQAVTWNLIERNPSDRIRNRRVKLDEDREMRLHLVGRGRGDRRRDRSPRYRALPIFLVGHGHATRGGARARMDETSTRRTASPRIERVHSQGRTKPCMKSDRQRRRVPLRAKVLEALDGASATHRLAARVPVEGRGRVHQAGDVLLRHWTPALKAAGIEHRGVYTCRHTFASWSIPGGMSSST